MKTIFISFLAVCLLLSSCHQKPATSTLGFKYQGLKDAEARIVSKYDPAVYDSYTLRSIENSLIEIITKDTASLSYDFPILKTLDFIDINTSEDGKLRFYTWDTGRGGTMIDWECIIQYRIKDKVYAYSMSIYDLPEFNEEINIKSETDNEKCAILNLLTFKRTGGDNCYAAEVYFRESSNFAYYGMVGLTFHNNQLVRYPLFENSENEYISDIGYEGTIADWYFMTNGLGWDWVYSYEPITKCLYEPLCGEDSFVMTDRYNVYKFNGEHFTFTGTNGGFWLYPPLRTFSSLVGIFETSTHIVRIDNIDNGQLRYAAWRKPKCMSDCPDIVITHGSYDIDNDIFVFINNGYKYEVYLDASKRGNYKHKYEGIKLYKNDKYVLSEPRLD